MGKAVSFPLRNYRNVDSFPGMVNTQILERGPQLLQH
jgi:hypothetical protein